MSIQSRGIGNEIDVPAEVGDGLAIVVIGDHNRVIIGPGTRVPRGRFTIKASHSVVEIGSKCVLNVQCDIKASHAYLSVGAGTTAMGLHLSLHEAGKIAIGEDCMFSGDIHMDVSDMHSIIDIQSGRRINPAADICVGRHVWVAFGAFITKGVTIGAHTVIGARALVTSDIPDHCVAAGVPARVLRTGVTWHRDRLPIDAKAG